MASAFFVLHATGSFRHACAIDMNRDIQSRKIKILKEVYITINGAFVSLTAPTPGQSQGRERAVR